MKRRLQRYRRRLLDGPWQLEGSTADGVTGAVVIPACAEAASLPATLNSLAAHPPAQLQRWLVVVVVNHPPDAPPQMADDNRRTLHRLRQQAPPGLQLALVDAASAGRLLPATGAGVGLARKLGCDLALERLDPEGPALLTWLDADTLVDADYLGALEEHFAHHAEPGATLPFAHRPAASAVDQAAIELYELYLRHYVLGLRLAGSPYAYHSLGSALACRASGYLAAGGGNRRRAGEDFYFLQQLAKIGGVRALSGTLVRPSARRSARVPFGTGEKVARLAAGEQAVRFYPAENFRILRHWLNTVKNHPQAPAEELLARLAEKSAPAAAFLTENGFTRSWPKLQRQHRAHGQLLRAFHAWFDALRSLRMVRYLARLQPPPPPLQAVAELCAWQGLQSGGERTELLHRLRRLQNRSHE